MSDAITIRGKIRAFLRCERGATSIEYGIIAAGVSIVISALVFAIGGSMEARFQDVVDALTG